MPNLEVGTVLVEYGSWNSTPTLHKVVRLTATQAITDTGKRYRLSDHRLIGGYGTAIIAEPRHYQEIARARLERRAIAAISAFRPREATDDTLTALVALLTPTEMPNA